MIATTSLAPTGDIVAQTGDLSGMLPVTETGKFDFLNYLLGLQLQNPQNPDGTDFKAQFAEFEIAEERDKPLLDVLGGGSQAGTASVMLGVPVANNIPLVGTNNALLQAGVKGGADLRLDKTQRPAPSSARVFEQELGSPLSVLHPGLDIRGDTNSPFQEGLSAKMPALSWNQVQKYTATNPTPQMSVSHSQLNTEVGEVAVQNTQVTIQQLPELDQSEFSRSQESTDGSPVIVSTISQPHVLTNPAPVPENSGSTQAITVPKLFEQVEGLIEQGGGKMTVSLNPPELGEVNVEVISRGNRIEVEIASKNDLAKSIIESGLGELKHSIQQHDLVVSKMEVHLTKSVEDPFASSMAQFGHGGTKGQPSQLGEFSNHNSNKENKKNGSIRSVGEISGQMMGPIMARNQLAEGSSRLNLKI